MTREFPSAGPSQQRVRPRLLIATIPAGVGGPQRHVESLCTHPGFIERFECEVWQVPDRYRGLAGKWSLRRDALERLRVSRPDAIYLNVDLSLAFWLALSLRSAGGAPLVVHSHNSAFESPRSKAVRMAYRSGVLALAQYRVAVSPEAARAMFGSEEDVAIVPSLIDFAALHAAAGGPPPTAARERFTFACVGRLVAQKNQSLAIEALARIRDRGLDADLILVGDGDDRRALELLAQRLGVDDRVRVTGEAASAAPVYAYAVDAVLVTSLYEGQSRVIAEAQSFGLPVLASAGVPDSAWIRSDPRDRRGLPLDCGIWADAMCAAMVEPAERTPMSMSELVELEHGLVGGSRRLVALLEDAMAATARGVRRGGDPGRGGRALNDGR